MKWNGRGEYMRMHHCATQQSLFNLLTEFQLFMGAFADQAKILEKTGIRIERHGTKLPAAW